MLQCKTSRRGAEPNAQSDIQITECRNVSSFARQDGEGQRLIAPVLAPPKRFAVSIQIHGFGPQRVKPDNDKLCVWEKCQPNLAFTAALALEKSIWPA